MGTQPHARLTVARDISVGDVLDPPATPAAVVPNVRPALEKEPPAPTRRCCSSVWRERALARLGALHEELRCVPRSPESDSRAEQAARYLADAVTIASQKPSLWRAWLGVDVEGTRTRIHAIEVTLLRLSTLAAVKAKLSGLVVEGSQLLQPDDPRLMTLRDYTDWPQLSDEDREPIAQCARTVYDAAEHQAQRLRSFRNILLGTTLILTLVAVAVGIICAAMPSAIYLAPTVATAASWPKDLPAMAGTDMLVIELLGLISASLAGSVAIRQLRGTSTPYSVPMASLLLKLPTGALTAVVGLLLIRAGVAGQGLEAAAGPQLVAYGLIFGASQQTFTRLIDRQTQNVLNSTPAHDRDAAREA